MNHRVSLIGVDLHCIQNKNVDLFIKCKGSSKLISLDSSDKALNAFHCNARLIVMPIARNYRLKVGKRCFFVTGNFMIDEEKKLALIFENDWGKKMTPHFNIAAYIIGENGHFKTVGLGESLCTPGPMCSFLCSKFYSNQVNQAYELVFLLSSSFNINLFLISSMQLYNEDLSY